LALQLKSGLSAFDEVQRIAGAALSEELEKVLLDSRDRCARKTKLVEEQCSELEKKAKNGGPKSTEELDAQAKASAIQEKTTALQLKMEREQAELEADMARKKANIARLRALNSGNKPNHTNSTDVPSANDSRRELLSAIEIAVEPVSLRAESSSALSSRLSLAESQSQESSSQLSNPIKDFAAGVKGPMKKLKAKHAEKAGKTEAKKKAAQEKKEKADGQEKAQWVLIRNIAIKSAIKQTQSMVHATLAACQQMATSVNLSIHAPNASNASNITLVQQVTELDKQLFLN